MASWRAFRSRPSVTTCCFSPCCRRICWSFACPFVPAFDCCAWILMPCLWLRWFLAEVREPDSHEHLLQAQILLPKRSRRTSSPSLGFFACAHVSEAVWTRDRQYSRWNRAFHFQHVRSRPNLVQLIGVVLIGGFIHFNVCCHMYIGCLDRVNW